MADLGDRLDRQGGLGGRGGDEQRRRAPLGEESRGARGREIQRAREKQRGSRGVQSGAEEGL